MVEQFSMGSTKWNVFTKLAGRINYIDIHFDFLPDKLGFEKAMYVLHSSKTHSACKNTVLCDLSTFWCSI